MKNKKYIVFIDDAQGGYWNKSFWVSLIKWLPDLLRKYQIHIQFVILATHILEMSENPSPAEFKGFPRLQRDNFMLTCDESTQFIDFFF